MFCFAELPSFSRCDLKNMPVQMSKVVLIASVAIGLKLLLIPAAHSTDFEVHRHWKALTYNRPLRDWYTDKSSVWTLDYPPLFAYFEFLLARLIAPIYPSLLLLSNHGYTSFAAVVILRVTVLLADPFLIIASTSIVRDELLPITLILCNPALIIVDNIHFQYNSIPLALLLCALSALRYDRIPLAAALSVLMVHLKHTFCPVALPLICHVLAKLPNMPFSATVFYRTCLATVITSLVIWLPFLRFGDIDLIRKIAGQLNPLQRGLMHANWAPSFWALYAVSDKLLTRLGFALRTPDLPITTGKIGAIRPFAVLPNPTPTICVTLAILTATPSLARATTQKSFATLVHSVSSTCLAFVLFGWHVHEKALLVPLLPLTAIATSCERSRIALSLLSPAAHLVILDLVSNNPAALAARTLTIAYHVMLLITITSNIPHRTRMAVTAYAVGAAVIDFYAHAGGHSLLFKHHLPFLPKMIAAVYGSIGVIASFIVLTFL